MAAQVLSVVGARPQFIKAAAVSRAFRHHGGLEERMVHTGQHFDDNMSNVFFEELAIPAPAYNLEIHSGGHGEMTGRMLAGLEEVMLAERPDAVLVYGDTNSTLAGALAASKLHNPVIHVEAGLRSFNRRMPEEINRVIADHLSDLLFCPTREAVTNLANEGIARGVHRVGDVMYDATLFAAEAARKRPDRLASLGLSAKTYALCTIHRAENTDEPSQMRRIVGFLEEQAKERPIVFPVHPRTRKALAQLGFAPKGILLVEPLGYLDMHALLAEAAVVFTNSGGLQKEAYFHRVPCVTVRNETEWVETVAAGWNRLWTTPDYSPRRDIDEYGEGNAAELVVEEIAEFIASMGRR